MTEQVRAFPGKASGLVGSLLGRDQWRGSETGRAFKAGLYSLGKRKFCSVGERAFPLMHLNHQASGPWRYSALPFLPSPHIKLMDRANCLLQKPYMWDVIGFYFTFLYCMLSSIGTVTALVRIREVDCPRAIFSFLDS